MTETTSEIKKRKIVLCFEEPKELKGDNIYVTLTRAQMGLLAEARSKEDFKVLHPFGSSQVLESNYKYFSNLVQGIKDSCQSPYQNLLEHLVQANNCEIDYAPLIEQGARAYESVRRVADQVARWADD